MQKDFCNEDGALFIGDTVNEIIPRISGLIERAFFLKKPSFNKETLPKKYHSSFMYKGL